MVRGASRVSWVTNRFSRGISCGRDREWAAVAWGWESQFFLWALQAGVYMDRMGYV